MTIKIHQGDIVTIDFEPSKGHEIKKRRPALVVSRDAYNLATPFLIVCPITSTLRERPYLISLEEPVQDGTLDKASKVNTIQLFTLDQTPAGKRHVNVIGHLNESEFMIISQYILQNFDFNR